jgi:hypothetical protein
VALRHAESVSLTIAIAAAIPYTSSKPQNSITVTNNADPSSLLAEIGVAFCSGGGFFFVFGLILFFDRALLAMGNILFLIGITLLLGPQRTFVFFARKNKWKGTLAFWAGVLLILMRWPLIGFGVELFGIFVLFGVCFYAARYEPWTCLGKRFIEADVGGIYRSSSRRSQGSRTISRLLGLTWRVDCRLRETRLARTNGRTRICLYRNIVTIG